MVDFPKYVDYAEYYDYDVSNITVDIPFFLEYAKQTGGPILELACGTGRVLIPLAEAGYNIHGLDISENMLRIAEKKVKEKKLSNLVTLTLGDMADYDLPVKDFSMAFITFRSFQHLYTQVDQLSCLECTYEHLRPGGLLIIDVYAPRYSKLAQPPDDEYRIHKEYTLPNGNKVLNKRRWRGTDLVNQVNTENFLFEEYDPKGELVRSTHVPLQTRYTFRYELQLLLERAGFRLLSVFKDFEKNLYDGIGEIITVAEKPSQPTNR